MDAQDFRSLQEAYLEVYELDEDWKPVNVPRVKSRMGSLEQGIRQTVSSPDNTPEYARYQRTADVVAQSTSNPNKPFQKPTFDPGGLVKKPEGGITSSPERNPQWQPFSSRLPVAATKPEKQGPGVPDRLKNQTAPRPGRGPTSKPVAPPAAKPNPRSISGSSAPRPGRGSTSNWMTDRMGEFTSALNRLSTPTKPTKSANPTKGGRGGRGGGSGLRSSGLGADSSPAGLGRFQIGTGTMFANSYEPDVFDVILEYLLDEGYAETQEQAEVIMVNMSEEWREGILSEAILEYQPFKDKRKRVKSKVKEFESQKTKNPEDLGFRNARLQKRIDSMKNVLGKKNKEIRSASQQKSYDNMAKGGFKHHDDPESKYYIK